MRRVFGSILGGEAGDIAIIVSFDPFGGEIEAGSNRDFKVWELCVFNIPFRGLVIGFLVVGHLVSESSDLLTKSVLHRTVHHFTSLDGFKESFANGPEGNSINVIADSIEGCCDCVR
jgi:hypothetical protein